MDPQPHPQHRHRSGAKWEPPNEPSVPDHTVHFRIGRGSYGDIWYATNANTTPRAVTFLYRSQFQDERPYE
jgi:hypothetical protein